MRRFVLLACLISSTPALPQTGTCEECKLVPKVLWVESTPVVPRAGQPVSYRVRLVGDPTVCRLALGDKQTDMRRVSAGIYALDTVAAKADAVDMMRPTLGQWRGYNGPQLRCFNNAIGQVFTDEVPPARLTRLAPDAQRTDFLVNLVLPAAYTGPEGTAFTINLQQVARRFYQVMADDFDMLNITVIPSFYTNRYHVNVKNTVRGLGMTQYDNSADYGSKGRLMGINVYPSGYFYDGADQGSIHEIGHQWMVHPPSGEFHDNVGAHWPLSTVATGVMGFSDITDDKDTRGQGLRLPCIFTPNNGGLRGVFSATSPYNDWELYMMGLIPPGETGTHYSFTDSALFDGLRAGRCPVTVAANQIKPVTIQDWIATAGPRVPDSTTSPKSLRVANILVTRELASADTMSFYDMFARRFEDKQSQVIVKTGITASEEPPFLAATGKRMTLSAQLTSTALPEITSVANGATFGNTVAPGSFASLFGKELAAATIGAESLPLPTTLGGVSVFVNGRRAPLYFVSPGQINFQVPWNLPVNEPDVNALTNFARYTMISVRVQRDDLPSNVALVRMQENSPGILTYGAGLAVAQDANGQLIGPDNPVARGGVATLYLSGVSRLSETPETGAAAPSDRLVSVTGNYRVSIGGLPAEVLFFGLTPGQVGLGQLNVRIPATVRAGAVGVQVSIDGPYLTYGLGVSNLATLNVVQ
ncbi:MAG: hypothetical protein U0Q16_09600 [Bryobacteraceae bacterium]